MHHTNGPSDTQETNELNQNMCINNMKDKASELGCKPGDLRCLCDAPDYSYGVRDCTAQACPDDDSHAVVQIALSTCPSDSKFPSTKYFRINPPC